MKQPKLQKKDSNLLDKTIKGIEKLKLVSKEILDFYKTNIDSKAKIYSLDMEDLNSGLELNAYIGTGGSSDYKKLSKDKSDKLDAFINRKDWKSKGIEEFDYYNGNSIKITVKIK